MVYILLLPALLLLWLGYRQYRWLVHYSKAKKHYYLSNKNIAFVISIREKFHSTKLISLAIFLVLYTVVLENLSNLINSQVELIYFVFLSILVVLCFVLFTIQSKSEKNFNLVLAKVQDYRNNSVILDGQKNLILKSYITAKRNFMIFSTIYSALNLSIIFLV